MIKLYCDNTEIKFEVTKFPDGTSQVWKIQEDAIFGLYQVIWQFENEAEFFQVIQLGRLLMQESAMAVLYVPFLPYGRQDKGVANDATFAREPFLNILNTYFASVVTFDSHSKAHGLVSHTPKQFFITILNHDIVCFPDSGAKRRYQSIFPKEQQFVVADKKRNQQTGVIEGYTLYTKGLDLNGKRILVCDDICDGGGTFIALASELRNHNPAQLDLAVSHGIFSKGKQVLFDAGYTNLYTTNSLLSNPEGYNVL